VYRTLWLLLEAIFGGKQCPAFGPAEEKAHSLMTVQSLRVVRDRWMQSEIHILDCLQLQISGDQLRRWALMHEQTNFNWMQLGANTVDAKPC
jgi:hypothetical protein